MHPPRLLHTTDPDLHHHFVSFASCIIRFSMNNIVGFVCKIAYWKRNAMLARHQKGTGQQTEEFYDADERQSRFDYSFLSITLRSLCDACDKKSRASMLCCCFCWRFAVYSTGTEYNMFFFCCNKQWCVLVLVCAGCVPCSTAA
jgi:hypothetical protein